MGPQPDSSPILGSKLFPGLLQLWQYHQLSSSKTGKWVSFLTHGSQFSLQPVSAQTCPSQRVHIVLFPHARCTQPSGQLKLTFPHFQVGVKASSQKCPTSSLQLSCIHSTPTCLTTTPNTQHESRPFLSQKSYDIHRATPIPMLWLAPQAMPPVTNPQTISSHLDYNTTNGESNSNNDRKLLPSSTMCQAGTACLPGTLTASA